MSDHIGAKMFQMLDEAKAAGYRAGIEAAVRALEGMVAESMAAREKAQTQTYRFQLKEEADSLNAAIERIKALR